MRPEVQESARRHSTEFVIVRQRLQSGFCLGSPSSLAAFAHRKTASESQMSAFFKLPNLVCGLSNSKAAVGHTDGKVGFVRSAAARYSI
jgi:hypothetical protein